MYGQWACLTCVQYIPIVRQWPFGSLSWWQVDCLCVPSWENRVLQFLPGSLQPWRLKAYLKEPPVCHPAGPLISLTSSYPALPWQPVTSHTRVWDVTPHIVLCSTCLQFLWLYVLQAADPLIVCPPAGLHALPGCWWSTVLLPCWSITILITFIVAFAKGLQIWLLQVHQDTLILTYLVSWSTELVFDGVWYEALVVWNLFPQSFTFLAHKSVFIVIM